MKGSVATLWALCGLAVVSAWPQQSEAEIAEEAARDAQIYKEMMQFDVFGRRLAPSAVHFGSPKNDNPTPLKDGECNVCAAGQFFHECNIGGMTEGKEFTCKDAFNYLHKGATEDECKAIQGIAANCCNASVPAPEEKCDAPLPTPNCTSHQESIKCVDGYRPADKCAIPWTKDGKTYTGCYKGWTGGQWCSHDAVYKSGSGHSQCEQCKESVSADKDQAKWMPALERMRCIKGIATSGDQHERVLTFENGGEAMDHVFPAFSAGKWVSTVAIAGAVHDGFLKWETKASETFSWWTKNATDPRSRVTLANLMNFVDGFVNIDGISQFTHDPLKQRCLTPGLANFYTPEQCAKQIYDTAKFAGVRQDSHMNATTPGAEPGTWFDYNSYHQQISLGMATVASGMDARDLLKKYVLDPAGMKDSYWLGGSNPCLSGFLQTNTNDYDSFLRAHAGYKLIPKEVADRTETLVFHDFGKKGGAQQYGSEPMISFENFAMGLYHQDERLTMGGNIGNTLDRRTGHYSMVASSSKIPYQFQVLMQVYDFHQHVEDIWASGHNETLLV